MIDKHGNAMSCTPSDGSNNTPIIPGVGILCSGRGTQSTDTYALKGIAQALDRANQQCQQ